MFEKWRPQKIGPLFTLEDLKLFCEEGWNIIIIFIKKERKKREEDISDKINTILKMLSVKVFIKSVINMAPWRGENEDDGK